MTTQLFARREHFGVLLYSRELGRYLRISENDASALENAVNHGRQGNATLANLGPLDRYERFQWISNPRSHPLALSAPMKIFFNITKRCNLHCRHCFNDSGYASSPEIPGQRVVEILSDMERLGIFRLTLAGGEPTIHKAFPSISRRIADSDLTVSMVTNGQGLDESVVGMLADNDRIRSVTVSVDGATADANDRVRGRGSYARLVSGTRRLAAVYKYDLHLRMTLTRPAISSLGEVPKLLETAGVNALKVNRCNPYGRAQNRLDLVPSQEEYEAAHRRLVETADKYGFELEIPSLKYVEGGFHQLCRAGDETAEIDGDGTLYPCSFSWGRFAAGNLLTDSMDDAILRLQGHTINNEFCLKCRGRGGDAVKPEGHETRLPLLTVS